MIHDFYICLDPINVIFFLQWISKTKCGEQKKEEKEKKKKEGQGERKN